MGWFGVDLDGTLAKYDGVWRGPTHIGEPIMRTVRRVRHWLNKGKDVRIYTARVATVLPSNGIMTPEVFKQVDDAARAEEAIHIYTRQLFGKELAVTCKKDFHMALCLDDRALQCYMNTGELIQERLRQAETRLAELGYVFEAGKGYVFSGRD